MPSRSPIAWLSELRAGVELVRALTEPTPAGLPRGEGGVLLIPGLWGGDESLFVLRRNLRALGYDAHTWGLGLNNRCGEETSERLVDRARWLRTRHQRPLAVIGHSRGGFFARELARRAPDAVDLVITLGTPLGARSLGEAAIGIQMMIGVSRTFFATKPGCLTPQCACAYAQNRFAPLPAGVSSYSLWSRDDGVVQPEQCGAEGEPAIEVHGSHVGMVLNREVLAVIARLLADRGGPN